MMVGLRVVVLVLQVELQAVEKVAVVTVVMQLVRVAWLHRHIPVVEVVGVVVQPIQIAMVVPVSFS
jgi:hypothetical protein